MARGGQNEKKERFYIQLIPSPTNKVEGREEWIKPFAAYVSKAYQRQMGTLVQFLLDGFKHDKPVATGEDGWAHIDIAIREVGNHSVYAQVESSLSPAQNFAIVEKPDEEKPKTKAPKRPIVQALNTAKKNKFVAVCRILDESNLPIEGAIVQMADKTTASGSVDLPPTDKLGVTKITVTLEPNEKERTISFLLLGTDLQQSKTFYQEVKDGR